MKSLIHKKIFGEISITVLVGAVLTLFFSCKSEIKTEYVDRPVDKKGDEVAPADIKDLAATAKDSRVLLTWTDSADIDVYGYEVSYSGTFAINRVVLPALNSTSMMAPQGAGGCFVSGLTNGTEYTFTVKTVDTSGNKSGGVTIKATPVAVDANSPMSISLRVPSAATNTTLDVTVNVTSAAGIKKVVYKKDGSINAKVLLADTDALNVTENVKTNGYFTISATNESSNGMYTVAVLDDAGREEIEQISVSNFDFEPPTSVTGVNGTYTSALATIDLSWTEPTTSDFDHVSISYTFYNGTSDSEASEPVTVPKGTLSKRFEGINSSAKYYTYSIVSIDALGNKSAPVKRKVSVSEALTPVPEGFVEVTGKVIDGTQTLTPPSGVFISGRSITIRNLYVCEHEVTQKEYEKYCRYQNPAYNPHNLNLGEGDNYPVYCVSWYDAIVYCNLRSRAEGLNPAYSINGETDPSQWPNIQQTAATPKKYCGPSYRESVWDSLSFDITVDGYRLPTFAEREYIARNCNNDSFLYSGSDNVDSVAWYDSNSGGKTHQVKTKAANGLGVYDMSGNVNEWCYDWDWNIQTNTGETGPASGNNRIVNGGGYNSSSSGCGFSTTFGGRQPYSGDNILGFRVVRTKQ